MPLAHAEGVELWYESFGDPDDPPLLLVAGLGRQAISWRDDFCAALVDRGFRVIRFDNRDCGLSSKVEHQVDVLAAGAAWLAGRPLQGPYLLSDLAADAVAVLDHAGAERAHVLGASMGGMIGQVLAIEHAERVATLTSVMANTGEPGVGWPEPDLLGALLRPPAATKEQAVEAEVAARRLLGSPEHFDEADVAAGAAAAYDRCYCPEGIARQLVAIVASPSRAHLLPEVAAPTLVVHGDQDRLIPPAGGERTAELVPGAEWLLFEGMGHDLPTPYWAPLIERVTALAGRFAASC